MPDDGEEIDALLVQYNAQFAEQGIVFRRLCACTKRVLVLVYNEEQLAQALSNPGYQRILLQQAMKPELLQKLTCIGLSSG